MALELGKVYVSLRDAEKAEARLREAVRETPLDSEANYFWGHCWCNRIGPGKVCHFCGMRCGHGHRFAGIATEYYWVGG